MRYIPVSLNLYIFLWEWKLFLPLQFKSNDIKEACLTRDSSSLDCIYKMYLRIFWLIVIFKGKRPSSALQAILEALLFTSKYRLQNWRCAFSNCGSRDILPWVNRRCVLLSLLNWKRIIRWMCQLFGSRWDYTPRCSILKRTLSYPILSVASKRCILLLTCLVCFSYQLYKASTKEMVKNSRAINILISKTVPQSIHS